MNEAAKKNALRKISYGLYVVGVRDGENLNAFTADWLSQCSFSPPLVMIGVRRDSGSNAMLRSGRVFAVSVLGRSQQEVAKHFLKPDRNGQSGNGKLDGFELADGTTGAPILADCAAWFECRVREIYDIGDHSVVIGEVVEAGNGTDEDALRLSDTPWHYGG